MEISFAAAGIAYYSLLSIFPMIVLSTALLTQVSDKPLANWIVRNAGLVLTASGESVVRAVLNTEAGRTGATLGSALLLLWSTLRLVRGVDVAFGRIYSTDRSKNLYKQVRDVLLVFLAIIAGLAGTIMAGLLISLSGIRFIGWIGGAALLVGLATVFIPLYYVLPQKDLRVAETLPGTAFAAMGWVVLQSAFRYYTTTYAVQYQFYGIMGAIAMLVTWLYLASHLIIVGAIVNAVVVEMS